MNYLYSFFGMDSGEAEESTTFQKIDLDDQFTLKHTLDDAAAVYVTESLNFKEDFWSSNLKLGIMTFACAVALLAQFFPMPFPESRVYVGICISIILMHGYGGGKGKFCGQSK